MKIDPGIVLCVIILIVALVLVFGSCSSSTSSGFQHRKDNSAGYYPSPASQPGFKWCDSVYNMCQQECHPGMSDPDCHQKCKGAFLQCRRFLHFPQAGPKTKDPESAQCRLAEDNCLGSCNSVQCTRECTDDYQDCMSQIPTSKRTLSKDPTGTACNINHTRCRKKCTDDKCFWCCDYINEACHTHNDCNNIYNPMVNNARWRTDERNCKFANPFFPWMWGMCPK